MKNLLITIVCLVMFSSLAMAQSPIHFGIKVGANYSNMKADIESVKTKYATGYLGGVFARLDLPAKFVIQPEIYYSLKKSQFEQEVNRNGSTVKVDSDLEKGDIDLALLLGYRLIDLELFNLRLMGGVVNSMNINDNLEEEFDEFEKNSLGYQAGVGADVANFTFDVRYEGSFSEIQDNFKYTGFQLAIGLKFI